MSDAHANRKIKLCKRRTHVRDVTRTSGIVLVLLAQLAGSLDFLVSSQCRHLNRGQLEISFIVTRVQTPFQQWGLRNGHSSQNYITVRSDNHAVSVRPCVVIVFSTLKIIVHSLIICADKAAQRSWIGIACLTWAQHSYRYSSPWAIVPRHVQHNEYVRRAKIV